MDSASRVVVIGLRKGVELRTGERKNAGVKLFLVSLKCVLGQF